MESDENKKRAAAAPKGEIRFRANDWPLLLLRILIGWDLIPSVSFRRYAEKVLASWSSGG